MSIKLMSHVWELQLPREQQTVLLALADHAHDDGSRCYPGVDYLAWKTGYARRSVQRILRSLEESHLIIPVSDQQGGRGQATEYLIDLTRGEKKQPFQPRSRPAYDTHKAASMPPSSSVKGDILAPFSSPSSSVKGDILAPFTDGKGDIQDEKRVSSATKRVPSATQKGDTHVTPTISNHQEPPTEPHTHSRASAAPATTSPECDGVCVPALTFDDYLGYARSTPTFTNPGGWAMKHYPLRDADPLVREWREQRELVRAGKTAAAEKRVPYHVAAQAVHSVAQVAGYDVAAYIDQMADVDEEVRARLREKFVKAPAEAADTS